MKITNFNQEYYNNLGYNVSNGNEIEIPIWQLSRGSGIKVKVKCNYCKNIFMQSYRNYFKNSKDSCCKNCKHHKFRKSNMKKYGVPCTLNTKENRKKVKNTFLKKYGTTVPPKNKEIKRKTRETMIKKYGVPYGIFNDEIRSKMNKKGNEIPTSKNQNILCEIYKGKNNYKIGYYFADIFLEKDNLVVEYDGGGHNLSVIHGRMTQQEFNERERKREVFIIKKGFRILRIVDSKNTFDKKENLLKIKEKALKEFKKGKNLFIYNIENKSETSFKI